MLKTVQPVKLLAIFLDNCQSVRPKWAHVENLPCLSEIKQKTRGIITPGMSPLSFHHRLIVLADGEAEEDFPKYIAMVMTSFGSPSTSSAEVADGTVVDPEFPIRR